MKKLIKKISRVAGGEFFKNVLVSLTGSGLAQLITLLALPVLTRLFTPAEFGLFAIYLSIANIIGNVAGGRMGSAIMIPKEDKEAYIILVLAFILTAFTSIVSFVIILFLKNQITTILSYSPDEWTFYFLPISIFLISTNRTLVVWLNRSKKFKTSAASRVVQTGSNSGINIALGSFTHMGMPGLFSGHIAGVGLSAFFLTGKSWLSLKGYQMPRRIELYHTLISNKNFLFFAVPFGLLNIFSGELLVYYFSIFFSASIVGFYSNANRVINYPLTLINVAFSSVFYQRISSEKNSLSVFRISWLLNLLLAGILLFPIVIWGESLFAFVLGEEWRMSGRFASILVPLAICSFAARSVAAVFSLLKKNEALLLWQVIYLSVILAVIYWLKASDIQTILFYFSLTGSGLYLLQSYLGYRLLKKNEKQDKTDLLTFVDKN